MVVCGIALLAASGGRSASTEKLAPLPDVANHPVAGPIDFGDDELIIREVFHSHLPKTLRMYALRLGVNPHLGDFSDKDYLRITTSLRYGLSKKCEISASSDLYVSHGSGTIGSFDEFGAANLELGTKLNLGQPLVRGWDTAVGVDCAFPTASPPAELTDGLRHFMPYVTFSHRLEAPRGLRVFWGLRFDDVSQTSVPGVPKENALNDNSTGITGGFVIDRKAWHYTFEASFDTTRWTGHSEAEIFKIRPGVIWEIPSRRHPRSRSNWVIGAAVSCKNGPGGTVLGASLKVRYNRNLKNRFRREPVAPPP